MYLFFGQPKMYRYPPLPITTAVLHVRQGMAWHTPPFVKPLLGARKSCLVDFLNERGQEWREDGSNKVAKYARNRVRCAVARLEGGAPLLR